MNCPKQLEPQHHPPIVETEKEPTHPVPDFMRGYTSDCQLYVLFHNTENLPLISAEYEFGHYDQFGIYAYRKGTSAPPLFIPGESIGITVFFGGKIHQESPNTVLPEISL